MNTTNTRNKKSLPTKNISQETDLLLLLVFGYLRDIEQILSCTTPTSIIFLCYHYSKTYKKLLFLFSGNIDFDEKPINNGIQFVNFDPINNYQHYTVKMRNYQINNKQNYDRDNCGYCITTNISLPKYIKNNININTKGMFPYSMIFRCGGLCGGENIDYKTPSPEPSTPIITTGSDVPKPAPTYVIKPPIRQKFCDAIIVDTSSINIKNDETIKIVNGYYIKLPQFSEPLSHCSSIYVKSTNKLICVGGAISKQNEDDVLIKSIFYLDFNVNSSGLKWKKYETKLNEAKQGCALCLDEKNNKLFVIGGDNTYDTYFHTVSADHIASGLKTVELFNLNKNDKQCTKLSDMNQERYRPGCLWMDDMNQIIVAGGEDKYTNDSCKTMEIYDCSKNQWVLLNAKMNRQHENPLLFTHVSNPNIVYIAGACIDHYHYGNRMHYIGGIEWIDLRENKFNKFDKNLMELFHLDDCSDDYLNWKARALLV